MHRKHTYMWAAVIAGSMVVSGCAGLTKGQADLDIGMKERGIASWYGDDFHGWVTASGEMYDMHTLTAAHRTLPLGTIVRVRLTIAALNRALSRMPTTRTVVTAATMSRAGRLR